MWPILAVGYNFRSLTSRPVRLERHGQRQTVLERTKKLRFAIFFGRGVGVRKRARQPSNKAAQQRMTLCDASPSDV